MPLTRIQSLGITDGTIVNADINASAAIAGTKLTGVGKVLQVVQTTKTDRFATSSATLVDITGLSVSITPSSASSKILIMFTLGSLQNNGNNSRAFASLIRGSTAIIIGDAGTGHEHTIGVCFRSNSGPDTQVSQSFQYLDSPNTTSSTTYKIQATVGSDGNNLQINGAYSQTAESGNTASTIIVMEIAA
jgi:hypothetical protein